VRATSLEPPPTRLQSRRSPSDCPDESSRSGPEEMIGRGRPSPSFSRRLSLPLTGATRTRPAAIAKPVGWSPLPVKIARSYRRDGRAPSARLYAAEGPGGIAMTRG
jgi:hypothetical protein